MRNALPASCLIVSASSMSPGVQVAWDAGLFHVDLWKCAVGLVLHAHLADAIVKSCAALHTVWCHVWNNTRTGRYLRCGTYHSRLCMSV